MSSAPFRTLFLCCLLTGVGCLSGWAQTSNPPVKPRRLLHTKSKPPAAKPVRTATPAEDPPAVRKRLAEALFLEASFKDSEALAKLQEVLKDSPQHYFALWQAAVLSVRIGQRYTDETRKAAYFDAARAYADRALAVQPEGGESNYAVALALFSQASLQTARARLAAFRDLRSHVVLAAERRPDWPDAWALLGRWQYRVAHYSLLERLFSKLALGGVPDGASTKEALATMEKAHRLDSTRLQFCYDLARAYTYQGKRRKAAELLRYAVKLTPVTSDDLTVLRRCQQLLVPLERHLARRERRRAQTQA
jgi:tetratricopeptide (TPR) repeat protein